MQASSSAKPRNETFVIDGKKKITRDERSGAHCISFPFDFNDDETGVMIICRLEDKEWKPEQDLKEITIKFQ